jgi:hypothetical protein
LENWLSAFSSHLKTGTPALSSLFLPDSYWRDHLCLSFVHQTAHTPENISALLASNKLVSLTLSGAPFIAPIDFAGEVPAICAVVDVKTTLGTGRGIVKLLEDVDGDGKWKAYTVFTALMGLDAVPERTGRERPNGVVHGSEAKRMNWRERRERERQFLDEEPAVVIVGTFDPPDNQRGS